MKKKTDNKNKTILIVAILITVVSVSLNGYLILGKSNSENPVYTVLCTCASQDMEVDPLDPGTWTSNDRDIHQADWHDYED